MRTKSKQVAGFLVILLGSVYIVWFFLPQVTPHDRQNDAGRPPVIHAQKATELKPNPKGLLPSLRDETAIFHIGSGQIIEQSHDLLIWGALLDAGGGPEMRAHQATAMKLNDPQRNDINKALKKAFNHMNKLQHDHVVVQSQTDTEVHLKVKPFPEEGARLRDDLEREIMQIIGDEDGPMIWEIMNEALQKSFRKFGSLERDIIGRVLPNGCNEVTEDGVTRGFPFAVSFDSMQQSLFRFEEEK
jgi:hypothetical protein